MPKHRFNQVSEELELADAAIAGAIEGIQAYLATTAGQINHLDESIRKAIAVTLDEINTPLSNLDRAIRDSVKNIQMRR